MQNASKALGALALIGLAATAIASPHPDMCRALRAHLGAASVRFEPVAVDATLSRP